MKTARAIHQGLGQGVGPLVAMLLIGGVAIASVATAIPEPAASPAALETPAPTASTEPSLPAHDVPGEDLGQLPRYPGALRTAYAETLSERHRSVEVDYGVTATLDAVRTYYRGVIADHGWQRADLGFAAGQWTYVLVAGELEALIEMTERGSLVEISLQLNEPFNGPPPAAPAQPAAEPPAPQPPAPPPPAHAPPDDDDDDDDDFDDASDD